jgi:hypothetical protein
MCQPIKLQIHLWTNRKSLSSVEYASTYCGSGEYSSRCTLHLSYTTDCRMLLTFVLRSNLSSCLVSELCAANVCALVFTEICRKPRYRKVWGQSYCDVGSSRYMWWRGSAVRGKTVSDMPQWKTNFFTFLNSRNMYIV